MVAVYCRLGLNTPLVFYQHVSRLSARKETFPEMSLACQKSTVDDPFDVNRIIVKVTADNIDCEGVSPLVVSMQSNICPLETSTVHENMNSSYLIAANSVAVDDTPKRTFLKQSIHLLSNQLDVKNKKLKVLQQALRRKKKKIASLKTIILQLKKENLITEDASDILLDSFGKHKDLITNWSKKNLNKKVQSHCTTICFILKLVISQNL